MHSKYPLAGLICSLAFAQGCSSGKPEVWQAIPDTAPEPASVGIHTIQRDGDIASMQTQILFTPESPSNKKLQQAGKHSLSFVIADYRYDCKARTAELVKAVEHFSASGSQAAPEPVETSYPSNASPVKPNSIAEDALNIACKPK